MTSKAEYRFYSDGALNKHWKNEFGQYHREDGPAVECANGRSYWYKNGKYHREDGPAIIWEDGTHSYYLNGNPYTKEEYWGKMREKRNDCES